VALLQLGPQGLTELARVNQGTFGWGPHSNEDTVRLDLAAYRRSAEIPLIGIRTQHTMCAGGMSEWLTLLERSGHDLRAVFHRAMASSDYNDCDCYPPNRTEAEQEDCEVRERLRSCTTTLSVVDAAPADDFHLRETCTISNGNYQLKGKATTAVSTCRWSPDAGSYVCP
jgi:hypothetical protein